MHLAEVWWWHFAVKRLKDVSYGLSMTARCFWWEVGDDFSFQIKCFEATVDLHVVVKIIERERARVRFPQWKRFHNQGTGPGGEHRTFPSLRGSLMSPLNSSLSSSHLRPPLNPGNHEAAFHFHLSFQK